MFHPELEEERKKANHTHATLKDSADRSDGQVEAINRLRAGKYIELTWASAEDDTDAMPWRRDVAFVQSKVGRKAKLIIVAKQQYHDEWVMQNREPIRTHCASLNIDEPRQHWPSE